MTIHHYGTFETIRSSVSPGTLVKHKNGVWTASANKRGKLFLHRGCERTYTKELFVEVYLDGFGDGLKH